MKSVKHTLQIVTYIFIILFFLVAVVFVIAAFNQSKTGVSGMFGYTFDVVQTNSMYPTIKEGDVVVGLKCDPNTTVINKDDIVTYKSQIDGKAATITHRVTRLVTDNGSMTEYETWGDNREDCPVPDESYRTIGDIISVYQFRIPLIGFFLNFVKKKIGFVLCVVVPLVAFIAWESYDVVKIYKKAMKENTATVAAETVDEASDNLKDAIIREYLEKQAADNAADKNSKK